MSQNIAAWPRAVITFDSIVLIAEGQEMRTPNGTRITAHFIGRPSLFWKLLTQKMVCPVVITNPLETIPKFRVEKIRLLRIVRASENFPYSYILYAEPVYSLKNIFQQRTISG